MGTTASFDFDRFARIWAMASHVPHAGSGNEHERANARNMAEAMAGRAGLTLREAVRMSTMRGSPGRSAPPKPKRPSFPLHPLEEALRAAGFDVEADQIALSDAIFDRIEAAIPRPKTIREALAELKTWNGIEAERQRLWSTYRLGTAAHLRRDFVEQFAADSEAKTLADAVARADWLHGRLCSGMSGSYDEIAGIAVAEDLKRMAARLEALARNERSQPAA